MNATAQIRLLTEAFPCYQESCAAIPASPSGVPWQFHLNNGTFDGTDALAVVAGGMPGLSELLAVPVESVPLDLFQSLGDGDVLFIDSSYALRCGGDVQYLYLDVVPRLALGVIVHVHDVFFAALVGRGSVWLRRSSEPAA